MKTRIILFTAMAFIICCFTGSKAQNAQQTQAADQQIKIYAAPELLDLAQKWTRQYSDFNPQSVFSVAEIRSDEVAENLGSGKILFLTEGELAKLNSPDSWQIVVGRNIIVPVANATNQFLAELTRRGLSSENLVKTLSQAPVSDWSALVGGKSEVPIHVYATADASVLAGVAQFLGKSDLFAGKISVVSASDFVSKMGSDANAIGFCKLTDVTDSKNEAFIPEIRLIPVDRNNNGKVDYIENISENLQSLTRGAWVGKYPASLMENVYAVKAEKPSAENEKAFLSWILNDGQQLLAAGGYNELVSNERVSQLEKVNAPENISEIKAGSKFALLKVIVLFLMGAVIIAISIEMIVHRRKPAKNLVQEPALSGNGAFSAESVVAPKGLYFDKTHTWAFMRKDGTVRIGIDDFIQHVTGRITRLELRNPGEKIKKGDRLFTLIRKGKQLNIYSPVSGIILAQNEVLTEQPGLVNSAPYDEGWIYQIEPSNWQIEIQMLSMENKYRTWLRDEFMRLKDFISTLIVSAEPKYATLVLQDGGELQEHFLAEMEPEVWEEFQTQFIDKTC